MELNTIVERAKKKDARAFDILYRAYRPKMVGICMNIIKEDQVVVDDLVHDAFILAFVSIGNLRDNARFGEWLSTIMRNVALKHVEQRDKLRLLPIASVSEGETLQMYSVSSPESDLNYKELLGLVNLLPEGYRRILRLSVIEGFSHKEIADMLGIEPHSSSSQLSRAKRMLRHIIESGAVWVLLILFAPIAWAIIVKHMEWHKEENVTHVRERHKHLKAESCDSIVEDQDSVQDTMLADSIVVVNVSMPTVVSFDTDSATFILPSAPIEEPVLEEIDGDSLGVNVHNYAPNLLFAPLRNTTEMVRCKDSEWHLRLTGSIGFALTQNSHPLINIDTSLLPGTDSIHSMLSNQVGTWEDYSTYLSCMPSQVDSIRTFVLKEISSHNTGKILQREHHSSPMTFGLSLARTLGRNWTVETGMQYSLPGKTSRRELVDAEIRLILSIIIPSELQKMIFECLPISSTINVFLHKSPISLRCSISKFIIRSMWGCDIDIILPFAICFLNTIQKVGAVKGLGLFSSVRFIIAVLYSFKYALSHASPKFTMYSVTPGYVVSN